MSSRDDAVPIQVVDCAKTFPDGTRALESLNVEIAGGETVVLLGPSGCGKTTSLRIIAGLESPNPGGRVEFGKDDVTDIPIEKRNVGMVFQNYALFPNLDVFGNIEYGLRVSRMPQAERHARVEEMLELMHIGPLRARKIDQLSGGQRQRVALARAIAVHPRVLLLDEPLTALDAKLRESLRVEIDSLLRRLGITTIYVTHDQAEAMALGDRIVVMSQGQVAQIGRPRDIYYKPASKFVADFIGTMNRVKGKIHDGKLDLRGGQLVWPCSEDADEIEVYFRPEDAEIAEDEGGNVAGTVTAAFFLGDRTRLLIEGVTDDALTVETALRREFQPGDRVSLRLYHDRMLRLS